MKDAFCLAFDLTPGKIMCHLFKVTFLFLDLCLNNHLHQQADANVDIRIRFSNPLPEPITVLYISTYDNIITLSIDKNVTLDYTV